MLAYNCSPSFNWRKNLDDNTIAKFQRELGTMGYKFQFITLAGFHALNLSMFELARNYKQDGMTAYCRLQEKEFCQRAGVRLRGRKAPALRRHRLFRHRATGNHQRHRFHHRARRFHRSRPIRGCRNRCVSPRSRKKKCAKQPQRTNLRSHNKRGRQKQEGGELIESPPLRFFGQLRPTAGSSPSRRSHISRVAPQ